MSPRSSGRPAVSRRRVKKSAAFITSPRSETCSSCNARKHLRTDFLVVVKHGNPANRPGLGNRLLSHELTRDEDRKKWFFREARAAASVDRPNLAAIFDIGEDEGHTFIVMEYVSGMSLREAIAAKKFDDRRCVKIAIQVAEALKQVHAAGIVHRDLKPENILMSAEDLGDIERSGSAYTIRVRAVDPMSSDVIAEAVETSVSKTGVLRAADELAREDPFHAEGTG